MTKRPVLSLKRSPSVLAPRLSLLDAAFVSILFTVAAASFLQVPFATLNPFRTTETERELPSRIVVWIQPSGRLDINGQTVEPAGLAAKLGELVALRPDLPVDVIARGEVAPATLVATLSAAKQAGARGVRVTQLDAAAAPLEVGAIALANRG